MKKEKNKLFIPNITRIEKDFLVGFGKKEFFQWLVGFFIGTIISIIIFLIFKNTVSFIVPFLGFVAISFYSVRKEKNNLSLADVFKHFFEFKKSRKIYPYRYYKNKKE